MFIILTVGIIIILILQFHNINDVEPYEETSEIVNCPYLHEIPKPSADGIIYINKTICLDGSHGPIKNLNFLSGKTIIVGKYQEGIVNRNKFYPFPCTIDELEYYIQLNKEVMR